MEELITKIREHLDSLNLKEETEDVFLVMQIENAILCEAFRQALKELQKSED